MKNPTDPKEPTKLTLITIITHTESTHCYNDLSMSSQRPSPPNRIHTCPAVAEATCTRPPSPLAMAWTRWSRGTRRRREPGSPRGRELRWDTRQCMGYWTVFMLTCLFTYLPWRENVWNISFFFTQCVINIKLKRAIGAKYDKRPLSAVK